MNKKAVKKPIGQSPVVFFKVGTFCTRAYIMLVSWFKEGVWKYFCRFVFICITNFLNKLKFND